MNASSISNVRHFGELRLNDRHLELSLLLVHMRFYLSIPFLLLLSARSSPHVLAERIEDVPCVSPCSSDLDCSLNGECIAGKCVCEVAWGGSCCDVLELLPVSNPSSYRVPNVSTWGGNIITTDNRTFHMWIAEMAPDPAKGGGCGLTTWGDNSQITHVTASSPLGPYRRNEVAVGIWSHNPVVRIDPRDHTLVMWHIGNGDRGHPLKGYCAHNGTSPCGEQSFDQCDIPSDLCTAAGQIPGWVCHRGMCSGDDGNGDCGPDIGEPRLTCNLSVADCAAAAVAACISTPSCKSFGLSDRWEGLNKAKLFSSGTAGLTPNNDWCVWIRSSSEDDPVQASSSMARASASRTARSVSPFSSTFYADMYERAYLHGTHPSKPLRPRADGSCSLSMHVSSSTEGPWIPYLGARIDPCGGNNPAPFYHPNGTLFIVFTDENMGLWRADSWKGPYSLVTRGACGGGEDPSLYFDSKGRFHCLFHRSPFSNPDIAIGHAYSVDGVRWYVAAAPAANSTIVYEGLGAVVHGKRERPHPIFNRNGDMTHLVTGVCIIPECDPLDGRSVDPRIDCSSKAQYHHCDANSPGPGWYDRTYTLVQALRAA